MVLTSVKNRKSVWIIFFILVVLLFVWQSGDSVSAINDDVMIKMVSGTEYMSGEEGQIIVRVADKMGRGVEGVVCQANLYFPDKNPVFENIIMNDSAAVGNKYLAFSVPHQIGVYEEEISCGNLKKGVVDAKFYISSSFHVSTALNLVDNLTVDEKMRADELSVKLENYDFERNKTLSILSDKVEYLEKKITLLESDIEDVGSDIGDRIKTSESSLRALIEEKTEESDKKNNEKFEQLGYALIKIFGNK